MERRDDSRQDRRGRRHLVASRVDQPQPAELDGQLGLDVAIEDAGFAADLEAQFQQDLGNATEVVLDGAPVRRPSHAARSSGLPPPRGGTLRRTGIDRLGHQLRWRRGRAAAGALGLGRTFGAALAARRPLGTAELVPLIYGGLLFSGLGAVGLKWPRGLAYPLGVMGVWLGITLFLDALKVWWKGPATAARTSAGRTPDAPDTSAHRSDLHRRPGQPAGRRPDHGQPVAGAARHALTAHRNPSSHGASHRSGRTPSDLGSRETTAASTRHPAIADPSADPVV